MTLNEAVTQFTQDYSYNTARTYRGALWRFIGWMRETGLPVTEATELSAQWAVPFARAMKKERLSTRTISVYLTALVGFMEWLKRSHSVQLSAEDIFELKAQVADWNSKHKAQKLARLPREQAVVTTLAAAHEIDADDDRARLCQLRNAAMLELWSSTGCRVSEAANLKRADLVPDKMAAWVRGGKGNKDRMIVFGSEDAWETVQTYLRERDKMGFTVPGEEPVIGRHDVIAHAHREILPISPESMRSALYKILQECGVEHFTPHQLRHRAGTALLRKTGNPAIVQKYLGHANVATTVNIYTHLTNDDLIEALRGG